MSVAEATGPTPEPTAQSDEAVGLAATETLTASVSAAFVMRVPSARIVACSTSGALLLDPSGGSVVGRSLEDFTTDGPTGALSLFEDGDITGYEAVRLLRRSGERSQQVRMWLRRYAEAPPSRYALVVLETGLSQPGASLQADSLSGSPVVGILDRSFRIERMSSDGTELFGGMTGDLSGTALIDLISEPDRASLQAALDEASAEQHGVTLYADVLTARRHDRSGRATCEVLILPLAPHRGCAFVLVPTPEGFSRSESFTDVRAMLFRLTRAVDVAGLARGHYAAMTEEDIPGLNKLTTRELEVVGRLLAGDRVASIAAELYVSPSTVRSHLGVVFAKLNVGSQQELVDLVRSARAKTTDGTG